MQVRAFKGPSAQTVLAMIKAELGSEAVILSSRDYVEQGVTWCEMTAGVDRDIPTQEGKDLQGQADARVRGSAPGWGEWHQEWNEIKAHLMTLMKPALRLDELAPRQRMALEYLGRQGVDDRVVLALYTRLRASAEVSVLEPLSRLMPVAPWIGGTWKQKAHVLCGPFGVGKTSAVIRMALAVRQNNAKARICLADADSQRGSGRMMLRHYAELCAMEYRNIAEPSGVTALAREAEGFDIILVDMPGLARDALLRNSLREKGIEMLDTGEGIAVHLVLSPLFSGAQMQAFFQQYACDKLCGLIWTKLDEACSFGALINGTVASGVPVTALSYGPGLQNSLVSARHAMIWRLLFKQELPDNSVKR